jgi:hypothetical protein
MHVTANAGFNFAEAEFLSPSSSFVLANNFTLVSGTVTDGTYQSTVVIPKGATPGTWTLRYINIFDKASNSRNYTQSGANPYPAGTPTALAVTTATATATPTPTPAPTPTLSSATFGNISTRLSVGTGDNVLIGGFIIKGTQPKKLIIRGIGPSLNVNGVPLIGRLADPTLSLFDSSEAQFGANDNWRSRQQRWLPAEWRQLTIWNPRCC